MAIRTPNRDSRAADTVVHEPGDLLGALEAISSAMSSDEGNVSLL